MKILVEGYEIETKEIVAIKEAGSRMHGFEIILIGPKVIKITKSEDYDSYSHQKAAINDRYRKLRDKIEEHWNKDKTNIPILNL